MGGCCCCFSKGVELNTSPRFYHYPIASEERQPLSSSNSGGVSALSTGLLVDTNLETSSIPDTYRPPPAPIPYDVNVDHHPRSPLSNNREASGVGEITISSNNSPSGETVIKETKGSECKDLTNIELVATKEVEDDLDKSGELKKPTGPILPPEECPTCLEEYDEENPKIITKCEHHFHLSCILEWMERSDTCKNQWARDDPAFIVICILLLAVSAVAYSAAYDHSTGHAVFVVLSVTCVHFLLAGAIVATFCWFVTNNYLREETSHSHVVEQRVEWLYAFDVHCNSFFPMFIVLYVIHFFISPLLVAHGFVPLLLSNLIFTVAISYYHYLNFLGYDVLPFLEKTTFFLYPIGVVIIFTPILILSGFNPSRYIMNIYFSQWS